MVFPIVASNRPDDDPGTSAGAGRRRGIRRASDDNPVFAAESGDRRGLTGLDFCDPDADCLVTGLFGSRLDSAGETAAVRDGGGTSTWSAAITVVPAQANHGSAPAHAARHFAPRRNEDLIMGLGE